jgi:START domain
MYSIKHIVKSVLLIVIIMVMGAVTTCLYAEPEWKLRKDEEGIKVYTANTDNSNFKSVKVECVVNARFSQLVAFLMDVDKQHDWVYGNKSSQLIKKTGANDMVFYSEVSVPWPCTNRDYIAHITVAQRSPQLVTIDSHSEPDLLPLKQGKIRVRSSVAHWEVTSSGKDGLKIVYTVSFDPSGTVPAWLTNLFITKGPFQTFQKLKEQVMLPAYQNAYVDFIKD